MAAPRMTTHEFREFMVGAAWVLHPITIPLPSGDRILVRWSWNTPDLEDSGLERTLDAAMKACVTSYGIFTAGVQP